MIIIFSKLNLYCFGHYAKLFMHSYLVIKTLFEVGTVSLVFQEKQLRAFIGKITYPKSHG